MKKIKSISRRIIESYERGEVPRLKILKTTDAFKNQINVLEKEIKILKEHTALGLSLINIKKEIENIDQSIIASRYIVNPPPGITKAIIPQEREEELLKTKKVLEQDLEHKTAQFKAILAMSEEKASRKKLLITPKIEQSTIEKTEEVVQLKKQLEQGAQEYQKMLEKISKLELQIKENQQEKRERQLEEKAKEEQLQKKQIEHLECLKQQLEEKNKTALADKDRTISRLQLCIKETEKRSNKQLDEKTREYGQQLATQKQTINQLIQEKTEQTTKQKAYEKLCSEKDEALGELRDQVTQMTSEVEILRKETATKEKELAAKELENSKLREELAKLKSTLAPPTMPEPILTPPTPLVQNTLASVGNNRTRILNARIQAELKAVRSQASASITEPKTALPPKSAKKKKKKNKKSTISTSSIVPVEIKPKETPFPFAKEIKLHPKLKEYYHIIHKSDMKIEDFKKLEQDAVYDKEAMEKFYGIYKVHLTVKGVMIPARNGSIFSSPLGKNSAINNYIFALEKMINNDFESAIRKLKEASEEYPPAQYMLSDIYKVLGDIYNSDIEKFDMVVAHYKMAVTYYKKALSAGHPCANNEKLKDLEALQEKVNSFRQISAQLFGLS